MKTLNFCPNNLACLLVVTTFALTGGMSHAQIVNDPFNAASAGNFTALSGETPATNFPGGTWATAGTGFTAEVDASNFLGPVGLDTAPSTPVDFALVNGDAATLSLSGYNSGVLTLSAYIAPHSGGAASLGFSPVAAGDLGYSFSGLGLDSTGGLYDIVNGTTTGYVAYGGGPIDASSTAYELSLTINTSTGALTGISVDGSTADYSSFLGGTTFTPTNTEFLALDSNIWGSYADLNLSGPTESVVPEPSTWALLLGGIPFLLLYRKISRRRDDKTA
jgi:hypothetical protein